MGETAENNQPPNMSHPNSSKLRMISSSLKLPTQTKIRSERRPTGLHMIKAPSDLLIETSSNSYNLSTKGRTTDIFIRGSLSCSMEYGSSIPRSVRLFLNPKTILPIACMTSRRTLQKRYLATSSTKEQ